MLHRVHRLRAPVALTAAFGLSMLLVVGAGAAVGRPNVQIAANQTDAYGEGQVIVFTYQQSFDCVDGPADDLDQNGIKSQQDPIEVNGPKCVAGRTSRLDPAGDASADTAPLFVIVPFFETNATVPAATNPDCQPGFGNIAALVTLRYLTIPCDSLGPTLQSLTAKLGLKRADGTGIVPDAFKVPTPGQPTKVAPVQCPEPGPPLTAFTGTFGTCTTHTNTVDLSRVVGSVLGLTGPVRLPTPNHSHIIEDNSYDLVWWKVIVELVVDPSVWPDANGDCPAHSGCLTSAQAMRSAQAAGKIFGGDIQTNFFLFFSADQFHSGH
ncbi:MAG: hypothetical protein E6I75_10010 [Chloroflexi bacterium]|nr:MAG: hypothetical protein E6I75_10010 [Chloroflexota bacterium]